MGQCVGSEGARRVGGRGQRVGLDEELAMSKNY